jgi:hypothetical protein
MSNKRKVIIGTALVAMFLLVSYMDHQDEQQQRRFFCEQVKTGIVPNYNNTDCEVTEDE